MSDIITPDFGRCPILKKGDIVSLDYAAWSGHYGDIHEELSGEDRVCGIVYSVDAHWDPGVVSRTGEDIGGQAIVVTIAVPMWEEWYLIPDVELGMLRRLVMRSFADYDVEVSGVEEGKVLQFDPEKRVTPREA